MTSTWRGQVDPWLPGAVDSLGHRGLVPSALPFSRTHPRVSSIFGPRMRLENPVPNKPTVSVDVKHHSTNCSSSDTQ